MRKRTELILLTIMLCVITQVYVSESVTLRWDDTNNKENLNFVLYEDVGCKGHWMIVDRNIPGMLTQYTVTNLQFATAYCFKVTARRFDKESDPSNVIKYMCKRFDEDTVCINKRIP